MLCASKIINEIAQSWTAIGLHFRVTYDVSTVNTTYHTLYALEHILILQQNLQQHLQSYHTHLLYCCPRATSTGDVYCIAVHLLTGANGNPLCRIATAVCAPQTTTESSCSLIIQHLQSYSSKSIFLESLAILTTF